MTSVISAGKTETWTNWAGDRTCHPQAIERPTSRGQLVDLIGRSAASGRQVTVRGSGHSFTGAPLTDDVMVDLSGLSGVIDADLDSGLVKVMGGTVLADANRELDRLGRALVNLGDIDRQTVAGAISTGTHGTGEMMPNLPAQVAALDIVTADGEVRTFSEDDGDEMIRAARVAVGSLGVISAVTLRTAPAFNLHREDVPMPLEQVLSDFEELAAAIRHRMASVPISCTSSIALNVASAGQTLPGSVIPRSTAEKGPPTGWARSASAYASPAST